MWYIMVSLGQGANISFEQVQSQIEVLNEDFRRSQGFNGYTNHPAGVDTSIEFFLATEGPEGNPLEEPGIDRVNGGRDEWPKGIIQNPIENVLKPSTIWDPEKYFNIWTVNFGGFIGRNLLGYAQFPDQSGLNGLDPDEGIASTDGVVIGYKYFGSRENGDFLNGILVLTFSQVVNDTNDSWSYSGYISIISQNVALLDASAFEYLYEIDLKSGEVTQVDR